MYTENDFVLIRKQTRIRVILLIALICLFVAVLVVFNSLRMQVLTCATAAIGFIVSYFLCSFKVAPYVKYNRFLKDVKTGQRRVTECEFKYFTPETRMHDGVEVHEMIVSVASTVGKDEEDERLFYWDADKQQPDYTEGDMISVTSYGNFVVDCKKAYNQ